MSQQNVDTVRRANEALKRGDREAALADYHPDAVWHDLAHAPDSAERVQGLPAALHVSVVVMLKNGVQLRRLRFGLSTPVGSSI